ncbi:hypothetical protein NQ314_009696 [Rhamnusium bicolor]|uniref:Uncharacterized protein n=1 Tax=Rhamnusium bicolor TaxID=1586634 RepID=A0AAV8XX24_9CUCU|nr:hypothetical protein NQ314_009696 [Rhamnusium bicolor]
MYQLYLDDCRDANVPNENIAKEWLYSEIFNYEYDYSFKTSDSDTYICDKYKIQLQESSVEERTTLQEDYERHLTDANKRYSLKSEDKKRSRLTNSEKVLMIDLQKCLPMSELHNSQSFYSLKLWTYNLTIQTPRFKNVFA